MKYQIAITIFLLVFMNQAGEARHAEVKKSRQVNWFWEPSGVLSRKLKAYKRPHFYEEIQEIKEGISLATDSDLETFELRAKHLLFGEEILLEELKSISDDTPEIKSLIDESAMRIALATDLNLRITKEQNDRAIEKADSSLEKPLDKIPPVLFDESKLRRDSQWVPPSRPIIEPK